MLTVNEIVFLRQLLREATVKGPANGRIIASLDDKLKQLQVDTNLAQAHQVVADSGDPAGE